MVGSGRHRLLLLGAAGPLAAGVLQGWIAAGFTVAEAWTGLSPQATVRRRDRRLRFIAPPWSAAALLAGQGAAIRQVPRLSGWVDVEAAARASGADVVISAGFMQRVPRVLLDAFPGRTFNLHPALLPRRRGPQPVVAALLEGTIEADGGTTLHCMNEALDEGDIVAQLPVRFDRTRPYAHAFALGTAAARLVARDLPRHLAGTLPATPQDRSLATSAVVDPAALAIGRHTTLAAVVDLLATLGRLRPIPIADGPAGISVRGSVRRLGPPTGAPPRIGPFSVELDIADARVALRRRLRTHRWLATAQRYAEAFVADRKVQ